VKYKIGITINEISEVISKFKLNKIKIENTTDDNCSNIESKSSLKVSDLVK
jgi:hypothetical protein